MCDNESNDKSDDESEVEDEYDIYLEPTEEGSPFPHPRLLLDVNDLSKETLLPKLNDYLHELWGVWYAWLRLLKTDFITSDFPDWM